jgi:hypothetical protein
VSDHEFLFALELSDETAFDRMLTELADAVLVFAGLSKPAIDELKAVVREALASGVAHGRRRCDVRFQAHGGELHVVVAYDGAAAWQTTRSIP